MKHNSYTKRISDIEKHIEWFNIQKEPKTLISLFLERKISIKCEDQDDMEYMYSTYPNHIRYTEYSRYDRYSREWMEHILNTIYFNPDYPYLSLDDFGFFQNRSFPLEKTHISLDEIKNNGIFHPEVQYFSQFTSEFMSDSIHDARIIENIKSAKIGDLIFIRDPSEQYPTTGKCYLKDEKTLEFICLK